jgi:UDP-N-acetylenolpyruvoylglucosamine reductase
MGGQSLYTALGIPAAVGGVFGTQAIRGDYGPALRRAVAGIVSNPQELRRVLEAPERQRPGLIMTLARNVLTAEAGTGTADIMSLIGEENATQKR